MPPAAIEFRKVSKRFGSNQILQDVSFQVQESEICFLLGRSGTGKSVTLKCLVGLLKPDQGEIYLNGNRVWGYQDEDFKAIRRMCGMVFQHPALFDSMSVEENISYGLRRQTDWSKAKIKERVRECLSLVHLEGIESKKPQTLSYGEQKRVSLARTLALSPKILLFDEPTTGLDPLNTLAINQLIHELSRKLKTTSVVVSHDMKCALEIADRIFFLEQGKFVAEGTPDEVLKHEHHLVKEFFMEVSGETP